MNPVSIQVHDLVGPICAGATDARLLHDRIAPLVRAGQPIVLVFDRVHTIMSVFFDIAIGRLFGEFPEERIRKNRSVRGLSPDDERLLEVLIESAKRYYANPEAYDRARRGELGREDDHRGVGLGDLGILAATRAGNDG